MRMLGCLATVSTAAAFAAGIGVPAATDAGGLVEGELLPTGVRITPTATPGAVFEALNADLATRPAFLADHAASTAMSPDAKTLLVLTTGYNRNNASGSGAPIPAESNEYVFVFDATRSPPRKTQVLQVPNTFFGIAWNPSGREFYVTGGVDDAVHVYALQGGTWAEKTPGSPIALGHGAGNGLQLKPAAAGVAVNGAGTKLVVANYENDSVSIVDLATGKASDVDLRPGKVDSSRAGTPGGEYPFWVAIRGDDAYVSSQRDGEVVVVDLAIARVTARIPVGHQPGKMLLDRAGRNLFVVNASDDTVSVIDTGHRQVVDEIPVAAPRGLLGNRSGLKGANPNGLALSPDERTLYVTNGGTNSVAVVRLALVREMRERGKDDPEGDETEEGAFSRVVGLIPTGWYPSDLALSGEGDRLFVINGKSNAGQNPGGCRDTLSTRSVDLGPCNGRNQYVWQLEKAGLLTLPLPGPELSRLTLQVAANNRFQAALRGETRELMEHLRRHVKHVVYVIKENRTYDQVLGDLRGGDADPALNLFGERIAPNHHALARRFVNFDRFFDSGETSGVGWNWSTAARTTDAVEKTQPPNYAGRGLAYDWEGTNRNINVGLATVAERQAANPFSPTDPDLLPGTTDVSAPVMEDGSTAYLWNAALHRGLTVRNYGCFGDLARYSIPSGTQGYVPLDHDPRATGNVQFFPAKPELQAISDPYFRGYDQKYPDYWRFKEWEREFDAYAAEGDLPALQLVRFPHDHFGSFGSAIDGVNTPELQMADNDYAVGLLVEKISKSRFKNDTLVFVVEDDAQDGPDHVDAHRSVAYVVGPYVKQGAVVSQRYDTVSMVRTIEEVLGLEPMGLTDGFAEPMVEAFERKVRPWSYSAIAPDPLRATALPLPATARRSKQGGARLAARPSHDAGWWEGATRDEDFTREDAVSTERFNRVLWAGILGEGVPYPDERHGRDLSPRRLASPAGAASAADPNGRRE
jgi:YVTN family beta-propeller protein